jgi:hypothetical protein
MHQRHDWELHPRYGQKILVGIFQDLCTLTDLTGLFKW